MLFGRDGISSSNPIFCGILLGFVILVFQADAVIGQNPSVESPSVGQKNDIAASIEFETTDLGLSREGYAAIKWAELPGATQYQVADASGTELYDGTLPEFFISGLADGSYQFDVIALDDSGETIGRSTSPATLTVRHWPLTYALVAFGIGLTVMLFVVGMIVSGHRSTSATPERTTPEPVQ